MVFLFNYDGIVETFYHLLWLKEFDEKFNHFSFSLPHTILIKNNMPVTWYFSSKTGEILRRKPQNISNELICKEFSKSPSKSSIAAMYLYEVNEDLSLCKQFHLLDKVDKNKTLSRRVMIEYISHENLPNFLNDTTKSPFGVLQKFIDPYGSKNFIIEALWTPKMTLFSKKVNINNLFYDKLELMEKAATIDGNDIYSEVIQIKGPEISVTLREGLTQIVKHIATVSFDHIAIKRMICYLKIDENQKVWFLWCGSCRIERETIQNKASSQKIFAKNQQNRNKMHHTPLALGVIIKNPQKHKRIYSLSLRTPAEITKKERCLNCGNSFVKSEIVMCNYQTIIRKFKELGENENNVDSFKTESNYDEKKNTNKLKIPQLIKKLHPEISLKNYQKLEKNALFQQNLVEICLDCYMELTKNLKISGPDPEFLYKVTRNELNPIPEKQKIRPVSSISRNINQNPSQKFDYKKKNLIKEPLLDFLNKNTQGNELEAEVDKILKKQIENKMEVLTERLKKNKIRPVSSISVVSHNTRSTNFTIHNKNPSFY